MTEPQFKKKIIIPEGLIMRTILYSGPNMSEMGNIEEIREFIPKQTSNGCLDKAASRCLLEMMEHIIKGKFANIEISRKAPPRQKGKPRGLFAKKYQPMTDEYLEGIMKRCMTGRSYSDKPNFTETERRGRTYGADNCDTE
jgi:hypothetical protein